MEQPWVGIGDAVIVPPCRCALLVRGRHGGSHDESAGKPLMNGYAGMAVSRPSRRPRSRSIRLLSESSCRRVHLTSGSARSPRDPSLIRIVI